MTALYHEPVLGPETLELLNPEGDGLYLDGTVGGGGHAFLILQRCPGCRLVAVDQDPEALRFARARLAPFGDRVRFLQMRFDRALDDLEIHDRGLDGALLDLGISSHQVDAAERGFSFRRGTSLDMRMSGHGRSAADLLNQDDEATLSRIFREFGEEPRARALAREVVRRRGESPFRTSDDLVGSLHRVLRREPTHKEKARVFQALRIAVNRELEALERALEGIREALNAGGVMVVIAYHSLEDRMVKHAFREWSRDCVCPPGFPVCTCRGRALGETLTRKAVVAGDDEVSRNTRARSARLRAWRKAA
ncbi:MAG: 16S rRNA (cytosine(1402)-N(4))-methyltransferase RsmH [Gemmatimonadales bacterium]|jgi:16S rRNA (cytosine1402-N4)-methyltransferase|nr:MAG: 16S rRNA (cytosine(1402)-N(4))-methyltransferase RsmH [Gemmatimonadales bacterium]